MKLLTTVSLAALMISGLAISRTSRAATTSIALRSDAFPGQTYALRIVQNREGAIQEMIYQSDNGSVTVTASSLERGSQVLIRQEGHTIISMSADGDFNPQRGGHIEIHFTTNALWGSYKNFRILVDIQGNDLVVRSDPNYSDPHSDRNRYTSVFNSLFFKKASMGVSAIEPSEN